MPVLKPPEATKASRVTTMFDIVQVSFSAIRSAIVNGFEETVEWVSMSLTLSEKKATRP